VTKRSDPDFERRKALWGSVLATRGCQMVADGLITEKQRAAAETEFNEWVADAAQRQSLYLLALSARKPT
jgi:hypothetical protein